MNAKPVAISVSPVQVPKRNLDGLCLTLCTSRFDADDLHQETWLRALRGISQYDASRDFEPWVAKMCCARS